MYLAHRPFTSWELKSILLDSVLRFSHWEKGHMKMFGPKDGAKFGIFSTMETRLEFSRVFWRGNTLMCTLLWICIAVHSQRFLVTHFLSFLSRAPATFSCYFCGWRKALLKTHCLSGVCLYHSHLHRSGDDQAKAVCLKIWRASSAFKQAKKTLQMSGPHFKQQSISSVVVWSWWDLISAFLVYSL